MIELEELQADPPVPVDLVDPVHPSHLLHLSRLRHLARPPHPGAPSLLVDQLDLLAQERHQVR